MTERDDFFNLLIEDADRPFSGWDFSYISGTGRMQSEPLPWNYVSIILPYIRRTDSLLDMGTGGGELLSLLQPLPKHTCATEAYAPNVPIAKKRLEPLGVHIFKIEEEKETLPFRENTFELVINRHEFYDPLEVWRILEPSGHFITQQVGEQNDLAINKLLGNNSPINDQPWNAAYASRELEEQGFHVLSKMEAFPRTRFYDVGALVFYLKAIPWTVEDFTVESYNDVLLQIHKDILANGFVEVREQRFLLLTKIPD